MNLSRRIDALERSLAHARPLGLPRGTHRAIMDTIMRDELSIDCLRQACLLECEGGPPEEIQRLQDAAHERQRRLISEQHGRDVAKQFFAPG